MVRLSTALKMAIMPWGQTKLLRQEQEALGRYGEVAVPGEAEVVLPAGKVKVSYRESINTGLGGNDEIGFSEPRSLVVEVVPAAGGEPLEPKGSLGDSTTITRGDPPWSTATVGTVEVTEPGIHTVRATVGGTEELTEPMVLLG